MKPGIDLDNEVAARIMRVPPSLDFQYPYSTQILWAFHVIAKMHSLGFSWCIEQADDASIPTVHILLLRGSGERMEKISDYSCESLPHAICVTALAAIGWKE